MTITYSSIECYCISGFNFVYKFSKVSVQAKYISYSSTQAFSPLVIDYLTEAKNLKPLYSFSPNKNGIENAIAERKKFSVDRNLLVEVLQEQYIHLPNNEIALNQIEKLKSENTFTICTAHQPNLMTGYAYFIYKIMHAIKLADALKNDFPKQDFVPVYYMGSEDNDLEELGQFFFNKKKYIWDGNGQTGAVGRMKTDGLKPIIEAIFKEMGPPSEHLDSIKTTIENAYLKHNTIAEATTYFVHQLFGQFGLLIINPDSIKLKASFKKIIKDELWQQSSFPLVNETIKTINQNYKAQAQPRPINLFYLKDNLRERIEYDGQNWKVVNTTIQFNSQQLDEEVEKHPERFSPNVILRGVFQETILPNIVFIGGGAEVAYWLQLKSTFHHHQTFYPCILLRQSVLHISKKTNELIEKLDLDLVTYFRNINTIINDFVKAKSTHSLSVDAEQQMLFQIKDSLISKANEIDTTLQSSIEAAFTKMNRQLVIVEKKFLRAEKNKWSIEISRIQNIKNHLFPEGTLQERRENFLEQFLDSGPSYWRNLYDHFDPLRNEFLVLSESYI